MTDVWRRYWPLHLVALGIFAIVLIFASYLSARQRTADLRDERTRQSLCAILDRIPEHIDSGMDKARKLDGCGHPHPPTVFFGHPFPTPTPTVTVSPSPSGIPTHIIVRPGPTFARTATPAPRPSATRTKQPPSPSPSPSRTCVPLTHICT